MITNMKKILFLSALCLFCLLLAACTDVPVTTNPEESSALPAYATDHCFKDGNPVAAPERTDAPLPQAIQQFLSLIVEKEPPVYTEMIALPGYAAGRPPRLI